MSDTENGKFILWNIDVSLWFARIISPFIELKTSSHFLAANTADDIFAIAVESSVRVWIFLASGKQEFGSECA